MSSEAEDLRRAALSLSLDERAELAADLLASLDGKSDDDVEEAWATEIERRVLKLREDGVRGRDWNEIRAELQRGS